jgi:hypothetical protein
LHPNVDNVHVNGNIVILGLKNKMYQNNHIAPHMINIWMEKVKIDGGCKLTIFVKFRESISLIASSECKLTISAKFKCVLAIMPYFKKLKSKN